jgi:hypothetical protein
MAAGTEHAGSDIDLMILGDAGFAEVVHALVPAMASSPPLPTVRAI